MTLPSTSALAALEINSAKKEFTSVLITGASGLLGSNLAMHTRERSEHVVAIHNRHDFAASGVTSIQVNLTDHSAINKILESVRPQWVIHCAALTDVDWCQGHPKETKSINEDVSRNLSAAAREVGARFVYVSTDSVFDGRVGNYHEKDIADPINTYARSKLAGEQAVSAELEQSLIIRTNIYGWNVQDKQSLGEWVLNQLTTGQPVPGFSDVGFTPILVNDLSDVILDLMRSEATGLYHVGGSEPLSKYEFAIKLAETFGLNGELVFPRLVEDAKLNAPRPRYTGLRTDKVTGQLERQMPDAGEGLRRFKSLYESGYARRLKAQGGSRQQGGPIGKV